jgi:hypothetical protein
VPFTASHPAAVLPLLRLTRGRVALVPSALVIGSMVPDLPYFLPLPVGRSQTHQLSGVLTVDLVIGLAVVLVWHGLLGPAAVALAPAAVRARLPPGAPTPPRALLGAPSAVVLLVASLLVGCLTHVIWDGFTHYGGWGAEHVHWLHARQGWIRGYRWAQYASGVGGLAVLAGWAARWWRTTPERPDAGAATPPVGRSTRRAAGLVVGLPALVAGTVAAVPPLVAGGGPQLAAAAFRAVTRGGSAGLAAAALVAVLLYFRPSRGGAGRVGASG